MSNGRNTADASAFRMENLKSILERVQNPEELDDHPWAESLLVWDEAQRDPALARLRPGERLLIVVGKLFRQMMPGLPPRRGLRLDTRWGEFGLLAARYFAPLHFGTSFPPTLRDSWKEIDRSILLFVFGYADDSLSEDQKICYRLVGDEPDVAASSTLSDWHKKGLQRLANLLRGREAHLRRLETGMAGIGKPAKATTGRWPLLQVRKRLISSLLAGVLLLLLLFAGIKTYRIYALIEKVKGDAQAVEQVLPSSPDLQSLNATLDQLPALNRDLELLRKEVEPVLWLGPWLRWVPTYGGDLAQAGSLLDFAQRLTLSAQKTEIAFAPLLESSSSGKPSSLDEIATLLSQARPQLMQAQADLQKAQQARNQINPDALSQPIRDLIVQRIDPGMEWMQDGLSLAMALPSVLGAGSEGPKTYLLLVQNEDELRPSGGFITAVGKLVLDQGRIVDLSFEDSGELDNWSMPYPLAPWQLSQYMNSRVLLLRDANWFPDFPTSALYVEQLYAYTHQNSVNGIVAFDQRLLIMLLGTLGPLNVDGVPYPITADNVVAYMRSAKSPPSGESRPANWTRKAFIGSLANAILNRVLSGGLAEWRSVSAALLQALQQRHLLLQMDNQDMKAVIERRDWNGAVQSEQGDFLLVVDSNIGFNKTNAVVDTSLVYDVDLTDLSAPVGTLFVSHTNNANPDVPCIQWSQEGQIADEASYPIDRCYWDYMRVYVPQGARLLSSTPQSVPASWMILNQSVPPRVDKLEEGLPGVDSFGTLLVVPGGQTVNVSLRFALPAERILLQSKDQSFIYQLNFRKQPGTLAIPLTLRAHLPANAVLKSASPNWIVEGANIMIQTDLKEDAQLRVSFGLP